VLSPSTLDRTPWAALSDAWGTYRDDTGKWVWFRFDPTVDRR
jgi:hypothetical protein